MNKEELRRINKEKRNNLSCEKVLGKSKKACEILKEQKEYKDAKVVMLYYPLGNETNTLELFLDDEKKKFVFGHTVKETFEIIPLEATATDDFIKGEYGIFEPKSKKIFDKNKIDLVLVPGIAFDRFGARIGFGKGYYDRFLKDLSAFKIGFCYDFQIVDKIDISSHDIKMDMVITDKEVIYCE